MKIKELELNNFRGFEHLKIEFPDNNLAVFIGTNGSGKSSVLDALGVLLVSLIKEVLKKNQYDLPTIGLLFNENKINNNDINTFKKELKIFLATSDLQEIVIQNYREKPWGNNKFHNINKQDINLDQNGSIPTLIHYRVNRIVQSLTKTENNDLVKERIHLSKLHAYANALNSGITQFNDFIVWFKEAIEDENAEKIRRESFEYRDTRLEVVRQALKKLLNNLSSDLYENLRIIRLNNGQFIFEGLDREFLLAINKNGIELDINQLSDGEKTLIMLVCDIARRLTIANPTLKNKLEGEGVVMIDEIELHLHPKWQRNVLPALQKTFPNIQFIVTTHSPQVLGGVERESVFILKDFKLQEYKPYTKGRDSNSILLDVMGVDERDQAYSKKLDKLAKLLDEEKLKEASNLLDELKESFGENDVEINRIQTTLDFFDIELDD